jgi:hypothetical protein
LDYNQHLPIIRAINKYTMANFKLIILDYTENKTKLCELEQFFINLIKPVYNIMKEVGIRIRKKTKPMSEEQKFRLSLKRGVEHHRFGIRIAVISPTE